VRGECPVPRPECPYANRPEGCFSDTDHLYYPEVDYRDIIGQEFRELPENKQQKCRWEHDLRHTNEAPPERPDRQYMLGRIATAYADGQISLSKRKLRKLRMLNEHSYQDESNNQSQI